MDDETFVRKMYPHATIVEGRYTFQIYLDKWARRSVMFTSGSTRSGAWNDAARLIRSMDSCDKRMREGTLHNFEEAFGEDED